MSRNTKLTIVSIRTIAKTHTSLREGRLFADKDGAELQRYILASARSLRLLQTEGVEQGAILPVAKIEAMLKTIFFAAKREQVRRAAAAVVTADVSDPKLECRAAIFIDGLVLLETDATMDGWRVSNMATGLMHGELHASYQSALESARDLAADLRQKFAY